ncbi:MAG: SIS domain-containing protein [Solirubrobacteraceae bacterium]
MSGLTQREIASQPQLWRRAAALVDSVGDDLPRPGERVCFIGCGTSLYISQAAAALREAQGYGEADAFPASEVPLERDYDLAVAVSRSGTTTELLEVVRGLQPEVPVLALTADAESPLGVLAARVVELPFADEGSVVQTRFATCVLALLRASLGVEVEAVALDGERALRLDPPVDVQSIRQLVFLGSGWSVGLASEAGLKVREAAQAWSEAYPAMEYRHGPISVAQPGTVVWALSALPAGLAGEISFTGAALVEGSLDPMAELVRVQRLAVALAQARGLDPDQPRNLSRSVVLSSDAG